MTTAPDDATTDQPTPARKPARRRAKSNELAERIAHFGAVPAPTPGGSAEAEPTPKRERRRATTGRAVAKVTTAPPMLAEQPAPPAHYSARMQLTLTPDQARALKLAKVEDGIEGTARIRAMIALWIEDDRLRHRIDKRARSMR
jgi:hypothetical protein